MLADDTAVRNVTAYIESLPDNEPAATVSGNTERGADLYRTCVNCHGAQGQGIAAMNAPRLTNMSDWYLARQLKNFKEGVRGAHRQDYYGKQMALLAGAVPSDGINDLLAYINTLQPPSQEKDERTAMTN
jgi:cytochrome c oxidase subunit 2